MDKYGHINNMVYYGYFDTVVTDYLIRQAGLNADAGTSIGLVVESHCNYHKPIAFPAVIDCGLRVGKLGRSSVRYEIGVFAQGDNDVAATGHFVHVYVDRASMRPAPIAESMRVALEALVS
jgi:acyl-CoA thioester hydrolase